MLIHNAEVTGSLTINGIPYNTGSFTGSFFGDGSQLSGVTGATTASYVEYSNVGNKPALVSGSSQITYSGLSGIPAGIVSGSSQVTYSGLTGIPAGIVSGSDQITGFGIFATTGSNQFNGSQAVTGSLTVTGQVVAQTLNVQQVTSSIVYSSGSNIFGNSLGNTQQFTGSLQVSGSNHYVLGNVGVGTNSPVKTLDVQGTLAISNSPSSYWYMDRDDSDGRFKILTDTDNERFSISTTGAATFRGTGDDIVTIGNRTASQNAYLQLNAGSTSNAYINSIGSGSLILGANGAASNHLSISSTGAATFSGVLNGTTAIFGSNFSQNETSKVGISFASGYGQINSWGANTSTYGGLKFQLSVSNGGTFNALTIDPSGATSFSSTISAGQSLFQVLDTGVGTKTIVSTLERTGATPSGNQREVGIVFKDGNNPTIVGGITGIRYNSSGNFIGGLRFYVQNTSATPATSFSNLLEALTLDYTGAALFSSSVTAASGVIESGGLNIKGTGGIAKPDYLRLSNASAGGFFWDIWRDNTTGNLNFGSALGGAVSNYVSMQASGGISFNGDTAAANALDDYEEGTWTPVVKIGATTNTASVTRARYTKIGNVVYIQASIEGITKSGSGTLSIQGLPFTVGVNTTFGDVQGTLRWDDITSVGIIYPYFANNQTNIIMQDFSNTGYVNDVQDSQISSTYQLYGISGFYMV